MIEFMLNDDGILELRQHDIPPTVYLDHWALRRFSESEELGHRLTNALLVSSGTLALSWLNVVEFSKVTMTHQARSVEKLTAAILPRLFLMDSNPFDVIRREDGLLAGARPSAPHADPDLLRVFSGIKPTTLDPLTTHDLFAIAQKLELAQRLDRLADTVAGRILDLRGSLGLDRSFRRTVERLPAGRQIQRGTRYLLREMLRAIMIDKQTKISRNHAIDLLHAVVPVAYCEFVLLDAHWETQVARVRRRFDATPMLVPMARVYSGKRDGIDRFLCELEAGRPPTGR
jgi:hypothetical protein